MLVGLDDPQVLEAQSKKFSEILQIYKCEHQLPDGKMVSAIYGEKFADLAKDCAQMLGNHFREQRHPQPSIAMVDLGNNGTMAQFDAELWQVKINSLFFRKKEPLPFKHAKAVFSSLYHEYRHAEQFTLMIRYCWAKNPTWLRYEGMKYGWERNGHVETPAARVTVTEINKAFDEWRVAIVRMSDAEVQSMIRRSLTSLAGASVNIKVARELAWSPLSVLEGVSQALIEQAALWFQSRFRTWTEEYGGRKTISDPGRMFDVDETTAANLNLEDVGIYADSVDQELKAWNKVKPSAFPNWPISLDHQHGKALVALRNASKAFDGTAMRVCFDYLNDRRNRARERLKCSHERYEDVPLEKDAHAVERAIEEKLNLSSKNVDSVAKSSGIMKDKYLPKPTDWSGRAIQAGL